MRWQVQQHGVAGLSLDLGAPNSERWFEPTIRSPSPGARCGAIGWFEVASVDAEHRLGESEAGPALSRVNGGEIGGPLSALGVSRGVSFPLGLHHVVKAGRCLVDGGRERAGDLTLLSHVALGRRRSCAHPGAEARSLERLGLARSCSRAAEHLEFPELG